MNRPAASAIILFALGCAVVNRAYGVRVASGRHIRWDARL